MKIYKYNEFNEYEPVNEELLGGLVNFFKGLWKKMSDEITRLENDPNKIRDYVVNTILNYKSPNSIFKTEFDTFNKNQVITDDTVKNFLNEILNPETGIMGKKGIGTLFADSKMQGEKIKPKRIAIEFIINTARIAISKQVAYNPKNNKFERDNNGKFIDMTLMKDLKTLMVNKDKLDKVKISNWFITKLFTPMQNAAKSITEDQIRTAQQKGGVKVEEGDTAMTYDRLKEYKDEGTAVIYLLKDKTKEQYDKTKSPQEQTDVVGVKTINELKPEDGEDAVVFLNKDGQPVIKKSYDDIIGPAKETTTDTEQKLKVSLGKLQQNKDAMATILKLSDVLNDPAKSADAINKINTALQ
jgi:hypothetical protein